MPLITNSIIMIIFFSQDQFDDYGKPIIDKQNIYSCYWTDNLEESDLVKINSTQSSSTNVTSTNVTSKCQINDRFSTKPNKTNIVIVKDGEIFEPVMIEYDKCFLGNVTVFYLQKGSEKYAG